MSAASCLRLLAVLLVSMLAVVSQVESTEPTPTTRQLNETILDLAASLLTNLRPEEGSNTTTDITMMLDQIGSNPDMMPFVTNNLAEFMNGMSSPGSLGAMADNTSDNDTGSYSALSKQSDSSPP